MFESINSEEDRAVSPVIGVILMVAITVILAAVIAAFVLDLGDTSASAQASFDISQDDKELEVTVESADRLDDFQINVQDTDCVVNASDFSDLALEVGSTDSISDVTSGGLSDTDCNSNSVWEDDRELLFILEYEGQETAGQSFDWADVS